MRKVMVCLEMIQGLEMGIGCCQRWVNIVCLNGGKLLGTGKVVCRWGDHYMQIDSSKSCCLTWG